MRHSAGGLRVVLASLALLILSAAPGWAAKPRIAFFGFEMVNTSLQPTSREERARLGRLDDQLRAVLEKSGQYEVVDTAPVRKELEKLGGVRACNGCELQLARKLGASEAAYGWVQKVSNLILNINLVIESADSGKMLKGGSVDIRGDTDQSWTRGLAFLLEEHVFNR